MHTPTDTGNRTPSPGRNERDSTPQQHVSGTTQFSQFFGRLGILERRAASTLPRGAIVATSSVLYPIVDAITTAMESELGPQLCSIQMNVEPPDVCQGCGTTASSTIVSYNDYRLVCGAVRSDENELCAALDEALSFSIFLIGYSTIVVAVARTRVHMGLLSLLRITAKKGSKPIFSVSRGLQPFPPELVKQLSDAGVQTVPFIGPEADGVEYRSDRILQYAITFDAATVTCGFDSALREYLLLLLKPIYCGIRNAISERQLSRHAICCIDIPDVLQLADTYNKKDSCRIFSTDNYKRAVAVHKQAGMPFYTYMVSPQSEATAALDFPPLAGNPATDPFIVCCVHRYVCNGMHGKRLDSVPCTAKLLAVIVVLHDQLKVAHGDIRVSSVIQTRTTVDLFRFEHGTSLADGDEVCPAVYTPAAAEFKIFLLKLSAERQEMLSDVPALRARVIDIVGVLTFLLMENESNMMKVAATVIGSPDVGAATPTRELLSRMLSGAINHIKYYKDLLQFIEQHSLFDKETIAEVNAVPMKPSWSLGISHDRFFFDFETELEPYR